MPPLRRATAIYPDGNLDVHPVSAHALQVSSSTRLLVPVVQPAEVEQAQGCWRSRGIQTLGGERANNVKVEMNP